MAANRNPWRDIYSLEVWLSILKLTSADPKRGGASGLIDELTKLISQYHMIDKRDPGRLADRKQYLTSIANVGRRYLDAQDSLDAKSMKSAFDRHSDPNKRHKVEIKPGLGGTVGQMEQKIDPWILSLGGRALKKRAYIEQIEQFVNSTEATKNARAFIAYLKEQVNRDRSGALLPLTPGTKMEKLDPLHRDFEFHADAEGHIGNPSTDMARALQEWIAKGPDIPFFYWLEGHSICTATKHFDPTKKVAKVNYAGDSDPTVLRAWLQGGLVHARGLLAEEGGGPLSIQSFGTKPGHAFVWLKDGTLVSHEHRSGEFHHSSFAGGKKVRCAGTWLVKNGKVKLMDNNSGHYQPTDGHFLTLLELVAKSGAADGETKVGTHSTTQDFGSFFGPSNYITIDAYRQKVKGKATFVYADNDNLYQPG